MNVSINTANNSINAQNKNQVSTFIAGFNDKGVAIIEGGAVGLSAKKMGEIISSDLPKITAMDNSVWSYLNRLGWAMKKALSKMVRAKLNEVALRFMAATEKLPKEEAVKLVHRELKQVATHASELEDAYSFHIDIINSYGLEFNLDLLQIELTGVLSTDTDFMSLEDYARVESGEAQGDGWEQFDGYEEDDEAARWLKENNELKGLMSQRELMNTSERGGAANELNSKPIYVAVEADDWIAHAMSQNKAWWEKKAHYGALDFYKEAWAKDYTQFSKYIDSMFEDINGNISFSRSGVGNYIKLSRLYIKNAAYLKGLEDRKEKLESRIADNVMYDLRYKMLVDNTTAAAMQAAKTQENLDEINARIKELELTLHHLESVRNKHISLKRFVRFDNPLSDYTHYLAFEPLAFYEEMVRTKLKITEGRVSNVNAREKALEVFKTALGGARFEISQIDINQYNNDDIIILDKNGNPITKTLFKIDLFDTKSDEQLINFAAAMNALAWKQRTLTQQDARGEALASMLKRAKMVNKSTPTSIQTESEIRTEDLIFG